MPEIPTRSRRRRVSFLSLGLSLCLAGLPAAGALAADGAALYKSNCASCHGADGDSDTPVGKAMNVPQLKGSSLSAEAMVSFVQENDKHKGPAGKLNAEELEAIARAVKGF